MKSLHRLHCTALLAVACLAFSDGAPFPRQALRSTLIHATASTLSVRKRNHLVRETALNPFQTTLRAIKFWRHVGPIVIHYKLTEHWCRIAHSNNPDRRAKIWESLHTKHAPTGLKVILELRGLFVKIGQVMSSRADFIPRQYVDAFTTLQDNAPPCDKDRIEATIHDSLRSCQQVNMNDVFESIGEVLGRWVAICTIMRRTPEIGVCILL
jgi:aarF domain-containing kinase